MKYLNTFNELFENSNHIEYYRDVSGNVHAKRGSEVIGSIALYDYWSEAQYIQDKEILNNIIIPQGYEYVGMIDSYEEGKGIATNMLKYALDTTDKKGIVISKLFIAEKSIYAIMKKLNAESIPDWFILNK